MIQEEHMGSNQEKKCIQQNNNWRSTNKYEGTTVFQLKPGKKKGTIQAQTPKIWEIFIERPKVQEVRQCSGAQ